MNSIHTQDVTDRDLPQAADAHVDRTAIEESRYAKAARQIQTGKALVIVGFVLLLAGALAYCFFSIGTGINLDTGTTVPAAHAKWTLAGLFAMGTGALLWLLGSFLYSLGALESDPEGPDLYF